MNFTSFALGLCDPCTAMLQDQVRLDTTALICGSSEGAPRSAAEWARWYST